MTLLIADCALGTIYSFSFCDPVLYYEEGQFIADAVVTLSTQTK